MLVVVAVTRTRSTMVMWEGIEQEQQWLLQMLSNGSVSLLN